MFRKSSEVEQEKEGARSGRKRREMKQRDQTAFTQTENVISRPC